VRTVRPAPPPVGKLEESVPAHANSAGLAVGRARHWIPFMLLSGPPIMPRIGRAGPGSSSRAALRWNCALVFAHARLRTWAS
jgi:hypothetical protein